MRTWLRLFRHRVCRDIDCCSDSSAYYHSLIYTTSISNPFDGNSDTDRDPNAATNADTNTSSNSDRDSDSDTDRYGDDRAGTGTISFDFDFDFDIGTTPDNVHECCCSITNHDHRDNNRCYHRYDSYDSRSYHDHNGEYHHDNNDKQHQPAKRPRLLIRIPFVPRIIGRRLLPD